MDLREELVKIIEEKDVPIRSIARRLNITAGNAQRILKTGGRDIRVSTLQEYAEAIGWQVILVPKEEEVFVVKKEYLDMLEKEHSNVPTWYEVGKFIAEKDGKVYAMDNSGRKVCKAEFDTREEAIAWVKTITA